MSSVFSLGNIGVPRFLSFGRSSSFLSASGPIKLPSVEIIDIETSTDRTRRRLKHLLKANHANYSIIYHNLQFHNHTPHILGSAYFFGSSPGHLVEIYDKEAKQLDGWRDSPGEITKDDWREFLGKKEYQRAFVDFFEDQLVSKGYEWRKVVEEFLFGGDEPLMNNMICGLAHPLIHLGYAYELSSHTVAIEALAMGACCYNFLHKYLDDPSYTKPPSSVSPSTSPLELLRAVHFDKRFDNIFEHPGAQNVELLFDQKEELVLDYWNAWNLSCSDPTKIFAQSQMAAVALLVGTHKQDALFDFFLVHLLTSSHAVRILLPLIPAHFQIPLVRQWWLFTVAVYISQLRPTIDLSRINDVDLKGRDWKFVEHKALNGRPALDAHYVKALRAMREAAKTWGDEENYYLRAAVKFAEEFSHWGGFGPRDAEMERMENEMHR